MDLLRNLSRLCFLEINLPLLLRSVGHLKVGVLEVEVVQQERAKIFLHLFVCL
jgi:hypothetical protein